MPVTSKILKIAKDKLESTTNQKGFRIESLFFIFVCQFFFVSLRDKHKNNMIMKRFLLLVLCFAFLSSCTTVPLTGRKQLHLIPSSTLKSLSVSSFQEVKAESRLSTNADQNAILQRVGDRVRTAVEEYMSSIGKSAVLKDFAWEYILIDDPTVNAWVMPGARIAFYTGILPICKDENGIAVVMGHEIAHAVANHASERMSKALMLEFGSSVLATALSSQPATTQKLALSVFGISSNLFVALPHSRKNEYEADRLGTIFMAMAGYDPNAAPEFWERMMARSGNTSTSDFLSTHPANAKRIAELRTKVVPEAMQYFIPHEDSPSTLVIPPRSRSSRSNPVLNSIQSQQPAAAPRSRSERGNPTVNSATTPTSTPAAATPAAPRSRSER